MASFMPTRQVTFGRSAAPVATQPAHFQSQPQPQQASNLSFPYNANASNPYLSNPPSLALPGPSAPLYPSQPQPTSQPFASQSHAGTSQTASSNQTNAVAGPSSPPATAATPAPLTLEQQHITAVEGIVPTLQNIVATVNLDCRLDLKTIALHPRNAEYNPKVCYYAF